MRYSKALGGPPALPRDRLLLRLGQALEAELVADHEILTPQEGGGSSRLRKSQGNQYDVV